MATKNQEKVVQIIASKVSKGEKISLRQAIQESGVYGPSIKNHPHKLTRSQGYKELMERYLPDELLDQIHASLLVARNLESVTLPSDSDLTDEDIKEMVESAYGCALKRISRGPHAIYVYFYSPDSNARKAALDMAYKRKGRYAPVRVTFDKDPLEELSDVELDAELDKLNTQLANLDAKAKAGKSVKKTVKKSKMV